MFKFLEVLIDILLLVLSWRFYFSVFFSAIAAVVVWLLVPNPLDFFVAIAIAFAGPVIGIIWATRVVGDS